ncbi:MAG: hypothetical protein JRG73_19615 [Deltaproteobacteria bacterium]|nr:hypothetical protein [Deltaproteobacteria bacterium]
MMGKDETRQKQELLEHLQEESQKIVEEIELHYERLIQEFERRYPPLSYAEEVRLSDRSMKQWIARHCKRKV